MKYILILLIFSSCNFSRKKPPVSTEPLDTVQMKTVASVPEPALFETAFIKGTTRKVDNSIFTLYGVNIGNIKIPSGRIIACDPLHIDEYGIPFTRVFPTGEFPVQLSIAKMNDEELIAFGRILFSEEPVARWEFALQEGQEPIPVGGRKMHGYAVDAGVVLFMDEAAKKALPDSIVAETNGAVFTEMDKHYRKNWQYAVYHFGNHNLATFTTGFGDGRYGTYIGFDASGKPCRLVTDFDLFDWKKG
jgi:hypothetical protein